MSRYLFDLAVYRNGDLVAEVTGGVDTDLESDEADDTLTYHLCRVVAHNGEGPDELHMYEMEIRRHGYQAIAATFVADRWAE